MTYTATDLAGCLDQLPEKDFFFAKSLVDKAKRWAPSEKQSLWIDKLVRQAKGEAVAQPAAQVEISQNLERVIELFAKVGNKLNNPKILIRNGKEQPEADDLVIQLSVAGPKSKAPGTINVTSQGRYGENTWYGRIGLDGRFSVSKAGATIAFLYPTLRRFAEDPAKVAAEYGKWTGTCCFCRKALADARSIEVGYGKTCAANYQLPWGKKD